MTRSLAVLASLAALAIPGCMAANPVRPVLSCTNCGSLTYYGPQQPDPRVEMARVLTGGLSSVAGIVVGGDVLKSLGRASGATSTTTIERTANNNTTNNNTTNTTDRSAVADVSHTSISDTRSTTVSETSLTDTSAVTTDTGAAP